MSWGLRHIHKKRLEVCIYSGFTRTISTSRDVLIIYSYSSFWSSGYPNFGQWKPSKLVPESFRHDPTPLWVLTCFLQNKLFWDHLTYSVAQTWNQPISQDLLPNQVHFAKWTPSQKTEIPRFASKKGFICKAANWVHRTMNLKSTSKDRPVGVFMG